MVIKAILDEDFVNYKHPSMFICTSVCDFKCDRENGAPCCQNSELAMVQGRDVDDDQIIKRYLSNEITKAIVFGGLEPFDQYEELIKFINRLRTTYGCSDDVVIYTGYNPEELVGEIATMTHYQNIIVKFGRFLPNEQRHFDEVLGVYLASPNQFAEKVS